MALTLLLKERPLAGARALPAQLPSPSSPVAEQGEAVRWQTAWGPVGVARLEDDGQTLITEVRIDRRSLVSGLFYGVEGMHVGGTRRLEIAPHLAYGDRGVPAVIPASAVLTAEITILEALGVPIGPE